MSSFRAALDRIEGRVAVLILDSGNSHPEDIGKIECPVECLPDEVSEGDILVFNVRIDRAATRERKERVRKLIDKLVDKGKESAS